MERNFYPENFENYLKGHADQFKMTPSKKVWHGIYNDIRPGTRWPSVAMSMVFIFTLVIIGHLNTNDGRNTHLSNRISSESTKKSPSTTKTISPSLSNRGMQENGTNNIIAKENEDIDSNPQLFVPENIQPSLNETSFTQNIKAINADLEKSTIENILSDKIENNFQPVITNLSRVDELSPNASTSIIDATKKEQPLSTPSTEINSPEKETTDMDLQVTAKKIRKPTVTWSYYITPSVSYRNMSDDKTNNSVLHKPRLGYEAGTEMKFNLRKKLQITTGFQVNYSGYNTKANSTHPTISTLMLHSETPGFYNAYNTVSRYGNGTGTEFTTLKNYSLQASVPIGLQYVFGGNDDIKFGAAAAIQPSFIMASRGYLLSTDKRNYITDTDLFRRWNMNTNLSTYVSFASNSLNWQIGPQVRYQLLSTYSNRYPVKENLINYGIRIGISKAAK